MSLVGPTSAGTAYFLEGISGLQQQQALVQRQLSSGYRVLDASDAPAQTPELVGLGSSLAQVQNYQTTLTRVQSEATTAADALGSAISLLQKATTLAEQGANTTATPTTDQTLAQQVQSIQQQLVAIANTTSEGRYIFGGDNDTAAPYRYDPTSPTGVAQLTAQASTRTILSPSGVTVYQPLSAQQIFNPVDGTGAPTASSAFAALQTLVSALNAGDQTAIANSAASLGTVSAYLNQQQAYYGNAEQRLTSEQNTAATQATSLQVQISAIRDTDTTQAATELTQLSTDESAAYAAQAAIPVKSLFDYLG